MKPSLLLAYVNILDYVSQRPHSLVWCVTAAAAALLASHGF